MAFTKFKTKDLARSATLTKSRRRRVVFLSTSNPRSFDRRHRRSPSKNKHPLSTMSAPKDSPKMGSKTTYISSAQESQPKSKNQSPKPPKKNRPEINLIKKEQEASSETSETSNSSTKPPSIFDLDEVNGKPGPVDTPPSSPSSETALASEEKKPKKESKPTTTTPTPTPTTATKQKKRPVDQANPDHPQSSSKAAEKPRNKKTKMADSQLQRKQFLAALDRRWPNTEVGGQGLVNPNIFCYRRSVVQCLLNIPVFVNWLSKHHKVGGNQCPGTFEVTEKGKMIKKSALACLACALIRLSKAYWKPESKEELLQATRYFDQTVVKMSLSTLKFPAVDGSAKNAKAALRREVCGQQQDAAEFFRWILQALEEHGQMPRDEIRSIFQHTIEKEKRCPECDHRTVSQLTDNHMLLPIDGRNSLESMIAESLRLQKLPQVSCDNDKCKYNDQQKKRVDMSRKTTGITECPEILVVQINRAGFRRTGTYKLIDSVTFPPVLDLTSRLSPQSTETTAKYSLSGVVRHQGADVTHGHYIANSITPKGVREMNDLVVSRMKLSELLRPREGRGSSCLTPYLLFYTRLHDEDQSPLSQLGGSNNPPGDDSTSTKGPPKKTKPAKTTSTTTASTQTTSTKNPPNKTKPAKTTSTKSANATTSTSNSNAAHRSDDNPKKRKFRDAPQSGFKKHKNNNHRASKF